MNPGFLVDADRKSVSTAIKKKALWDMNYLKIGKPGKCGGKASTH